MRIVASAAFSKRFYCSLSICRTMIGIGKYFLKISNNYTLNNIEKYFNFYVQLLKT